MESFKKHWQIEKNWQLIIPFLGLAGLGYLAIKFSMLLFGSSLIGISISSILIFLLLLKICLFSINKLEGKWIVKQRWELIRIFIVFAITGSSSVLVTRPLIREMGITLDNLHAFIYWVLFILISLVAYQLLLLFFGWIFGQFEFFWNFEKKILKRFGINLDTL